MTMQVHMPTVLVVLVMYSTQMFITQEVEGYLDMVMLLDCI